MTEPNPPKNYAVACAACEKNIQPVTAVDVAVFLSDHEQCEDAITRFSVEVPASLTGELLRSNTYEVWAQQALAEGYRPVSSIEQMGTEDEPNRVHLVGNVVPVDHRRWAPVAGKYEHEMHVEPEQALTETVMWPPGGEPA